MVSYLQSCTHRKNIAYNSCHPLYYKQALYLSTFKLEFECCGIGIQVGAYFLVSFLTQHKSDISVQVILNSIPFTKVIILSP